MPARKRLRLDHVKQEEEESISFMTPSSNSERTSLDSRPNNRAPESAGVSAFDLLGDIEAEASETTQNDAGPSNGGSSFPNPGFELFEVQKPNTMQTPKGELTENDPSNAPFQLKECSKRENNAANGKASARYTPKLIKLSALDNSQPSDSKSNVLLISSANDDSTPDSSLTANPEETVEEAVARIINSINKETPITYKSYRCALANRRTPSLFALPPHSLRAYVFLNGSGKEVRINPDAQIGVEFQEKSHILIRREVVMCHLLMERNATYMVWDPPNEQIINHKIDVKIMHPSDKAMITTTAFPYRNQRFFRDTDRGYFLAVQAETIQKFLDQILRRQEAEAGGLLPIAASDLQNCKKVAMDTVIQSASNPNKKDNMLVKCKICEHVLARNKRTDHVAKHMSEDQKIPLYACSYPNCDYHYHTSKGVKMHITEEHYKELPVGVKNLMTREVKKRLKKLIDIDFVPLKPEVEEETGKSGSGGNWRREFREYCRICKEDVTGILTRRQFAICEHVSQHMLEIFNQPRYKCRICNANLNRKKEVVNHGLNEHQMNANFYFDDMQSWTSENVIKLSMMCFGDDQLIYQLMPMSWQKRHPIVDDNSKTSKSPNGEITDAKPDLDMPSTSGASLTSTISKVVVSQMRATVYCRICRVDVIIDNELNKELHEHVSLHMYDAFKITRYMCNMCKWEFAKYDDAQEHCIIFHQRSECYHDDILSWQPDNIRIISKMCFEDEYLLFQQMPHKWRGIWNIDLNTSVVIPQANGLLA